MTKQQGEDLLKACKALIEAAFDACGNRVEEYPIMFEERLYAVRDIVDEIEWRRTNEFR